MARRYFVFDASALAFKYIRSSDSETQKIRARLAKLFAARAQHPGSYDFQIPNICMAECGKAFAKSCFQKKIFGVNKAESAYSEMRDSLLKDVKDDRIISSYELKRYHFFDIEDIFRKDYALPLRGQSDYLSSHDALVISMAKWLGESQADSMEKVAIITGDVRIGEFCRRYNSEFPKAYIVSDSSFPSF